MRPTVVNLNPEAKRKVVLPPVIHAVRQKAKENLLKLVTKLFDSTDDALFEMADRSANNGDQSLFFESMRQIRLQRKNVIKAFLQQIYANFDGMFRPDDLDADGIGLDLGSVDVEDLALVGDDDMELSVAVSGIVSKVTGQYAPLISSLTERLDEVTEHQTVTERSNPLGPYALSQAFVTASSEIEIDIKIKIILLKLFERMVMQRLDRLYAETNRALIDAGVLPDLEKRKAPKRPAGPTTPQQTPGGPDASPSDTDHVLAGAEAGSPMAAAAPAGNGAAQGGSGQVGLGHRSPRRSNASGNRGVAAEFSVLQRLLAGAQPEPVSLYPGDYSGEEPGEIIPTSGVPDGLGGWRQPEPEPGSVSLTTDQLLSLLTALQTETVSQPVDVEHIPKQMDVRTALINKSSDVTGGNQGHMQQNDDDVISLVSMLFDYILNDKNLAIPMKALISRLQIPMIKIAVVDKSFFDNAMHPSRLLLNELATAGIGWSSAQELRRDALYDKIEETVLAVLNGDTGSAALYAELLQSLQDFLRKDTKRHALVEQRVLEAETGKARTRAAKEAAQKLINQKASGLLLPAGIGRFVSECWSRVLVFTATKNNLEGEQWQSQVQALDDLLWCAQPLSSKEDHAERQRRLPPLLETIETELATVIQVDAERARIIEDVRRDLDEAVRHDEAYFEDDLPETLAAPSTPDDYAAIEEIRLTEAQPEPPAQPVDEKYMRALDDLHIGGWVEIARTDQTPLRCKLSTVVQPGNRYVFVNRRGMKVADYADVELGLMFKLDSITLLDESEVFDRALQAVVGNLRKMQQAPVKID